MYTNVIGLNPGDISQIKVKINIQTTFNSEHQNSEAYSHHQTQFPNIKPLCFKTISISSQRVDAFLWDGCKKRFFLKDEETIEEDQCSKIICSIQILFLYPDLEK